MAPRLGERLVQAGLVTGDAIEKALKHQALTQLRLGDCLFELKLISEPALLRFLAKELKTRFVSAEKLAKATIPPSVLEKVPVALCEAQSVLPIAYDPERGLLSVLMAEPQNVDALKEIRTVSGVDEVFAYIALRSTLAAGIQRFYRGDKEAFSAIGKKEAPARADISALSHVYELGAAPDKPGAQVATGLSPVAGGPGKLDWPRATLSTHDFTHAISRWARLFDARRLDGPAHSTRVARLCAAIAKRLGMTPLDIQNMQLAAYSHDLTSAGEAQHCTLLSLVKRPAQRIHAQGALGAPMMLFEKSTLPRTVKLVLQQRFEAFNGSGLPHGLREDGISLGARILSAVDAWVDLTTHPENVFDRIVSGTEAHTLLGEHAGKLFDPVVLDALKHVTASEVLNRALLVDGRGIMICEPDDATRTDLLAALAPLNVDTYCVSKLESVFDGVLEHQGDLICLGLRQGIGEIAAAVHWVRGRPERAALPVVVVGQPQDPKAVSRLNRSGVNAFLKVPIDAAEVATTLGRLLTDYFGHGGAPRNVEGGLHQASLTDVAKLLGREKKTGKVSLFHGLFTGAVHFEQGRIVHARHHESSGQEALELMLALEDAEFVYEPDALLDASPTLNIDPTA